MKAPKKVIREKYALQFMTIIELWSIHIDHPVADPNTMSNGICFHTKDYMHVLLLFWSLAKKSSQVGQNMKFFWELLLLQLISFSQSVSLRNYIKEFSKKYSIVIFSLKKL